LHDAKKIHILSAKIMHKKIMLKIPIFLAALILFACGGGSGGSPEGGPSANPPELTSVNPPANASSVLLGSLITATFDKNMNEGEESTFGVYGSQTGKLSGTYTGGGSDTLNFGADNPFKTGEEIEVILTDMLTSTGGVSLESPFVYRFRAEALGGTGIFAVVDTVSGQTGVQALVAGDWDDNGYLDLAAANSNNNEVVILRNDGTGHFTFTAGDTIPDQTGVQALVAGDWDRDGYLDLAAASSNINYQVAILRNDGTGHFTVADTVEGQTGVKLLAVGDWDGDGDLDLAANNGTNTVIVLENGGSWHFTLVETVVGQTGVQALVAGDWDGDGDLDLAAANSNNNEVAILRNDGTGHFTFTAGDTVSGQTGVKVMAAGDWNRDGHLDLAANDGNNTVKVLENDGSGHFTVADTISSQTGIRALVAGDWDDNGYLDLAAANFDNNEVAILRNDGTGLSTFTAGDTVSPLTDVKLLAAGDWDGDGDLDLAANDGTNTVKVLGNDEVSP
jgi:hypothetical protein